MQPCAAGVLGAAVHLVIQRLTGGIALEVMCKDIHDVVQRLGQAELAGVANTGVRFISDLENGKGTIQIRKLLNVLNALGLGLYIFNRWENE